MLCQLSDSSPVLKKHCAGVETPGMKRCCYCRLVVQVLGFPILLLSTALAANTQQFQASWEQSSWEVETGPGQCALTHRIPQLGRARFEQVSGHQLQFSLQLDQPQPDDDRASLYFEAPAWNHAADQQVLGSFALKKGRTPLRVPRDQAMQIYQQLENGMQPVIEFGSAGERQERVRVALLPVRFRAALPAFLECTAGLLSLDFEPRSEKDVYFATNSDRLSRAARRTLEQIAREYRQRRNFRIVLGGFADARGEAAYNMELSRRRTAMAARYLRSRGVAGKAIETRYFGESNPRTEAAGEAAWRRDRRVTVWLADQ